MHNSCIVFGEARNPNPTHDVTDPPLYVQLVVEIADMCAALAVFSSRIRHDVVLPALACRSSRECYARFQQRVDGLKTSTYRESRKLAHYSVLRMNAGART